jgi:hypothetical protein
MMTQLAQGVGCEVGVADGDFSAQLLESVRPTHLFLIDAWKPYAELGNSWASNAEALEGSYQGVCTRFSGDSRVTIVRMDSVSGLKSIGMIDWAYIDANHAYDFVYADLCAAGAICRQWIFGHDYVSWGHFGVIRAVADFCALGGWKLEHVVDTPDYPHGENASYALRRISCSD